MDSKTWIEKNEKYVMNTYGRFDVVLESGKGCIAKDVKLTQIGRASCRERV